MSRCDDKRVTARLLAEAGLRVPAQRERVARHDLLGGVERHLAERDAREAELAEIGARTTRHRAAVADADLGGIARELRELLLEGDLRVGVRLDGRLLLEEVREVVPALRLEAGLQADLTHKAATEEERAAADDLLGLLTPVIKGYGTDSGYKVATARDDGAIYAIADILDRTRSVRHRIYPVVDERHRLVGQLTGDRVDSRPYQQVAAQYPEISEAEFQRAEEIAGVVRRAEREGAASLLGESTCAGNDTAVAAICTLVKDESTLVGDVSMQAGR